MRNGNLMFRFIVPIVLAIAMYCVVLRVEEQEQSPELQPLKPRYRPFLNSFLLMIWMLMFLPVILFTGKDYEGTLHALISMWFTASFHIGIYYLLLTAVLPLLRRWISARVCAALWLLPNYLYLIVSNSSYAPSRPLLVINLPVGFVQVILGIWLMGFIAIFVWKIVEHLRFRKQLLQTAVPVTDPEILAVWETEQQAAGYKNRRYPLLISSAAKTPLTIGFTGSSMRVILPEKSYFKEELSLILRHELIHWGRNDASTKLFLTFCTALCWINPFTWYAMRRSTDDLELSCDESVLLDADEASRRRYAELLLTTAADDRGFTSNLSNSAKALRYRLLQVMRPREKAAGAMVLAVIFYLLFVTCGYAAIPYAKTSGADAFFHSRKQSECMLNAVQLYGEKVPEQTYVPVSHFQCKDEEGLHAYLSGLQLSKLAGEFEYAQGKEHTLTFVYEISDGHVFIHFYDDLIGVQSLFHGKMTAYGYISDEKIDQEMLMSYMTPANE